jgi:protein O-GlcNAc transferase
MNRNQRRLAKKQRAKSETLACLAASQVDFQQAIRHYQVGRLAEAQRICQQILAADPQHADSLNLLGVMAYQLGRYDVAIESISQAIHVRNDVPFYYNNLGAAFKEQGKLVEALANVDRALIIRPDYVEALNNRGNVLADLKRYEESLTSYESALALKPDYVETLYNRGNSLLALKRHEEALSSYERALAIRPHHVNALNNRGNVLKELNRYEDALASYERAIAIKPGYFDALNNRGNVLKGLQRHKEALSSYEQAIAIRPGDADVLYNCGKVLDACAQYEEAIVYYERALAIKPDHRYGFDALADAALKVCDWARTTRFANEIVNSVAENRVVITPFTLLSYSSDASLQLKCARSYIRDKIPVMPPRVWEGGRYDHGRLRIAYLSADFHRHATAYLMAELFERHDRARFEVIGISFGADSNSDMRLRLVKSFDQFHDVRSQSDGDAAQLLKRLEVDIAIDLKGYTKDARVGILAHRPTPIQVNYLGYPGTMGAEFIDYVLADKTIAPFDQQEFCMEKIVHLPDCFQVNDSKREIAARVPTRPDVGLPERGFVFCCFNNNYKITPSVFNIWMRLLQSVEGSVLWLLRDNGAAESNLCKEAMARGIDPSRLVFADRRLPEEHLARHRLADLFLDTLPVNAGTTASDALWAGLPLLTCCGESVVSRVGASLLFAIGLPEMVANTLDEYEALAVKMATDPPLLLSIRRKLEHNRLAYPLFNTDRLRRHIEAAYTTMWKIWQNGEPPRSFTVEPQSEL